MNGACIINLDEYKTIGIHWAAFYGIGYVVTYLYSFGVQQILIKIKKSLATKKARQIFTVYKQTSQ